MTYTFRHAFKRPHFCKNSYVTKNFWLILAAKSFYIVDRSASYLPRRATASKFYNKYTTYALHLELFVVYLEV